MFDLPVITASIIIIAIVVVVADLIRLAWLAYRKGRQ